MNFSTDIDIGDTSFSLIDRIDLLGVDGLSAPCGQLNNETKNLPPDGPPAMTI